MWFNSKLNYAMIVNLLDDYWSMLDDVAWYVTNIQWWWMFLWNGVNTYWCALAWQWELYNDETKWWNVDVLFIMTLMNMMMMLNYLCEKMLMWWWNDLLVYGCIDVTMPWCVGVLLCYVMKWSCNMNYMGCALSSLYLVSIHHGQCYLIKDI